MSDRHPVRIQSQLDDRPTVAHLQRLAEHFATLDAKIKFYESLEESHQAPEEERVRKPGKVFFRMVWDSLYLDISLSIKKLLFEEKGRELTKYLQKCLDEYEALDIDPNDLSRECIEDQLEDVCKIKESTEAKQLQDIRNEWLAHHDGQAFDQPNEYQTLSVNNFRSLTDSPKEIVRTHCNVFNIGSQIDSKIFKIFPWQQEASASQALDDAACLLKVLDRFVRVRQKWARGEIKPEEALAELYPKESSHHDS